MTSRTSAGHTRRPVLPRPRGPRPPGVARNLIAFVLVVVAIAATVGQTGTALAHSAEGTMTVTVAEAPSPLAVRLEVGVLYGNDADLAEEASVSAVLSGPDGATVGPVALPKISGARYGTDITVPAAGSWTAAITATDPAATASATIEVPAASTSSTAATGNAGSTAGTTATTRPTTRETDTVDGTPPPRVTTTLPGTPTATTSSGGATVPILIGLAALVVVAGGALAWSRGRRTSRAS